MFLSADIKTLQHIHDRAVAFFRQSRNREQLNINTYSLWLSSLLHTTHFPRFTKSENVHSHDFLSSLFPKDQKFSFMSQLRSGQRYIETSYLVLLWAIISRFDTIQTPNITKTLSMTGFQCTKNICWSFHVFETKAGNQNLPRKTVWRSRWNDSTIRHWKYAIVCPWAESRGAGYINTTSFFSNTPSHLLHLFSESSTLLVYVLASLLFPKTDRRVVMRQSMNQDFSFQNWYPFTWWPSLAVPNNLLLSAIFQKTSSNQLYVFCKIKSTSSITANFPCPKYLQLHYMSVLEE